MSVNILMVLCLCGWIPLLAVSKILRDLTALGLESGRKQNPNEVARLRLELAEVREELEALRSTSTGFDLSFDKRLSEMELHLRLSKLKDVQSRDEQTHQGHE